MHKPSSSKRRHLGLYAVLTTALLGLGAATALAAGITPATAASLAHHTDTQIAVFMVPLTLLVLAVLVEATRITLRGTLPAEPVRHRPSRLNWKPGTGEG